MVKIHTRTMQFCDLHVGSGNDVVQLSRSICSLSQNHFDLVLFVPKGKGDSVTYLSKFANA